MNFELSIIYNYKNEFNALNTKINIIMCYIINCSILLISKRVRAGYGLQFQNPRAGQGIFNNK